MRYVIDVERNFTNIEVEKINENLCMITICISDSITEIVINEENLYELIGVLHLIQNQIKKK